MNFWYAIGQRLLPKLTWRRKTTEKEVFLTFDDGPHPEITPWVMNQLDTVGAKGTFFAVGENAKNHKAVIEDTIARGHQIGNHTFHHVKGWKVDTDTYNLEIKQCYEYIPTTGLFRPPYGQINFKSIPVILEDNEIIMWDILTKDYLPRLNKKIALKRIQRLTRNGSIIVFHDSEKSVKNLKYLLPRYLKFLTDNGYKMNAL